MAHCNVTIADQVVDVVATELNADPLDLPPLYDAIDPDALNAYIDALSDGKVSFSYAGVTVTVDSCGTIDVTDTAPGAGMARQADVGAGL